LSAVPVRTGKLRAVKRGRAGRRIARAGRTLLKVSRTADPIINPPFDDLSPLPRRRLAAMRAAARDLFKVLEECAKKSGHPVSDLLAASPEVFTRWEIYPDGGVKDEKTGSIWFYHAHDPSEARQWEEHGHFHCTVLKEKLGKGAKALALPPASETEQGHSAHIAAISIDASGVPKRLFATNRWVTGESMYVASEVIPLIDRYAIRAYRRFPLTSRWLSAMLRLHQPQIVWLLHERDRMINARRAEGLDAFTEDQTIEALSVVPIDVDAQLAALDRAWEVKRGRSAT
jgi:hypothetical protein